MIVITSKGAGILKLLLSAIGLMFSTRKVLRKENFEIKKARGGRAYIIHNNHEVSL